MVLDRIFNFNLDLSCGLVFSEGIHFFASRACFNCLSRATSQSSYLSFKKTLGSSASIKSLCPKDKALSDPLLYFKQRCQGRHSGVSVSLSISVALDKLVTHKEYGVELLIVYACSQLLHQCVKYFLKY